MFPGGQLEQEEQDGQRDKGVNAQAEHHGDKKFEERGNRAGSGLDQDRGDQAEHPDRREADDEVGYFHHDPQEALPEALLGLPVFFREPPGEKPEEQGEKDQAQQLSVVRGCIKDVGGNHPDKDLGDIPAPLAFHLFHEGTGILCLRKDRLRGFLVHLPGLDKVDQDQPGHDGE